MRWWRVSRWDKDGQACAWCLRKARRARLAILIDLRRNHPRAYRNRRKQIYAAIVEVRQERERIHKRVLQKEMYAARREARAVEKFYLWTPEQRRQREDRINETRRLRALRAEGVVPPRRRTFSREVRMLVIEAYKYRCAYCNRHSPSDHLDPDGVTWHIDHIMPRILNGPNDLENLALSCASCNQQKGALAGYEVDIPKGLTREALAAVRKRGSRFVGV